MLKLNLKSTVLMKNKQKNKEYKKDNLKGTVKNRLIKFYDTLIEECDKIETKRKESKTPVKLTWYRRNKNKKKKK